MSILLIIIIGGAIGWLASQLLGRNEGIFGSIVIGIVGSFIGSLISELTTGSNHSYLALSWSALIWSLIGSLVLVAILNSVSHTRHHV